MPPHQPTTSVFGSPTEWSKLGRAVEGGEACLDYRIREYLGPLEVFSVQDPETHPVRGNSIVMSQFDSTSLVFKSTAKKLAGLMAAGGERDRLWREDELAAVFRHQMAAPVLVDLGGFDPRAAALLKRLSEAQSLVLRSFSDLFQHPSPPREVLELVKNFAKTNMDHPDACLPGEIAAVLYYTSIAAALVRLGLRITHLSDADLRQGLVWANGQPWLDRGTRRLLRQALKKIPHGGGQENTAP